ncbi:class IV adenylate cyclase [Oceanidesulfovibrio marinus]|uniref:CYTH domain-containing protein n=1 Tax=Oceanidesulfovibrio marinus TaxID=370038 RepID=A0ABX6NCF6_9BACT|nr:class IV adenylate cyclase [Oceanidesulfovibrio marinus]QJT08282.1 CYTH domain-containing protein [Oceanidesulfovibrio marinus]
MALETEIKFKGADFDRVRTILLALSAERKGRWMERNLVFDDADRSLRRKGVLLRLRQDRNSVLTLKQPPAEEQEDVKVFHEHETIVQDFEAMRAILGGLGYTVAFRYEKVREEWAAGEVHVCLDEMPFGQFVELEGERVAILALARELGLSLDTSTTATYHALNQAWREEEGLAPDENFVFESPPDV